MKANVIIASLVAGIAGVSRGQAPAEKSTPADKATVAEKAAPGDKAAPAEKTETTPEMTAVLASARAYEAAYTKGDVKALGANFTEDAEYTAEDGRTFTGRPAIEESLRVAFLANKGAKLVIDVESARHLAPEVVLEKGSTTVTSKGGETVQALYNAIHLKQDGKWRINQLVETPLPEISPAERLSELAWMVGEWEEVDKTADLKVRSRYQWARGGNFLSRDVTVKRGDEVTLEGWQIIGWDPSEERLRSWTFDGEGGFSEGYFSREGDRWLLQETGVAPDGSRTTADNTITRLNDDRFAWASDNRTLNGQPQPSIGRIETNRVKGN